MKNFYLSISFLFMMLASVYGQHEATFTIIDSETTAPIENVNVSMNEEVLMTDAAGQVTFTGLVDGTYSYSLWINCYASGSGSLQIANSNSNLQESMEPNSANDVFFFVGSPMTIGGALVELTNEDGYYESLTTDAGPFANNIISNVPYGEYSYTITAPCYETVSGTVTVNCNEGNGNMVEVTPPSLTTNDLFFFVGSPMTIGGALVELTNEDGYYESLTTDAGPFANNIISNVPYGEYSYTITAPCYETVSGTVTVDCNEGNGNMVEATPASLTTNDLFFFVGSPMTIGGALVELTNEDGYYESMTTDAGPFANNIISNVPYGEYSYTITAPCYETVSGTVTVDCNEGNGNMVEATPASLTTNDLFFFVGSPMTIGGALVELTNEDGYYESLTTDAGPFANNIISNVPYGDYSYTITAPCYETVSGTVTVDCNEGNGNMVEATPPSLTTNDLFFFVGSPMTIGGALVELTNEDGYYESMTTDAGPFANNIISNVPYGEYSYTITAPCYETVSGTVTVDCNEGNGNMVEATPASLTTNDLFFFVGSPMTIGGALVELTNEDGYYESMTTDAGPFANNIISNVPYGEYSYTITAPCYETVSGTVTVDCNEGNGNIVEATPASLTTNDLFFFVGSPMTIGGAFVELTNEDGYYESLTTDAGPFANNIISNVPYGEYSYTITAPCYETVSGTVTVDCNEGNGNIVEVSPASLTTNDLFFFVGSPMTIGGAFVELTNEDGYYESMTTDAGPFANNIISNVPYGDYSYTITAPCYETVSGTVTVDCNEGNGNIVEVTPAEIVIDNTVTQDANTLTAMAEGYTYQWIDCDNENSVIDGETGQSFTATTDGNYAVIISTENCSIISECIEVLGTGIADKQPSLDVVVYPNPFTGNFNIQIQTAGEKTIVRVMTITGQVILNNNFSNEDLITINMSDLASGTYILQVLNTKGQYTSPIVKL